LASFKSFNITGFKQFQKNRLITKSKMQMYSVALGVVEKLSPKLMQPLLIEAYV